jgi:hypothetical protein
MLMKLEMYQRRTVFSNIVFDLTLEVQRTEKMLSLVWNIQGKH